MQTMDMSLAQHVKAGRITQQMAFERCHDPEELQRLDRAEPATSAVPSRRRSTGGGVDRHGAEVAAWSWAGCKGADDARYLPVQGPRQGGQHGHRHARGRQRAARPAAPARDGLHARSRWARRSAASTSRSTSRRPKVKLKDLSVFSRQFATMINSGLPILRALAILADQTENKPLGETLSDVPHGRRAGRVAVGRHGRSTRRCSTTSTSRW